MSGIFHTKMVFVGVLYTPDFNYIDPMQDNNSILDYCILYLPMWFVISEGFYHDEN